MLNLFFRSAVLFFVIPVLFILNGSHVFAIEKAVPRPSIDFKLGTKQTLLLAAKKAPSRNQVLNPTQKQNSTKNPIPPQLEKLKVNPFSVYLIVGEQQKFTLTGKEIGFARSVTVSKQGTLTREFITKLIKCNPTRSCTVGLTLKKNLSPGNYELKLFNAQRKPIAIGDFRVVKVASLASIKLDKQKAADGETIKGTITLTEITSATGSAKVKISSSNSRVAKIATVNPVTIPPRQKQAQFEVTAGETSGTAHISANLGDVTKKTPLTVTAPPKPFCYGSIRSPSTIDIISHMSPSSEIEYTVRIKHSIKIRQWHKGQLSPWRDATPPEGGRYGALKTMRDYTRPSSPDKKIVRTKQMSRCVVEVQVETQIETDKESFNTFKKSGSTRTYHTFQPKDKRTIVQCKHILSQIETSRPSATLKCFWNPIYMPVVPN